MTVQLGTNFHNDYADFVKGADDTQTRVGQKRATAQGWLTPAQTCRASCICLSMAATAGVLLLQLTAQWHNGLAWFVVVSSIWNAFADTVHVGPFPLGYIGMENWSIAYAGLGEVFVLLYFKWVAVLFLSYLLLTLSWDNMERHTCDIECMIGARSKGVLFDEKNKECKDITTIRGWPKSELGKKLGEIVQSCFCPDHRPDASILNQQLRKFVAEIRPEHGDVEVRSSHFFIPSIRALVGMTCWVRIIDCAILELVHCSFGSVQ